MSDFELHTKLDFRHFIPRMNYYAGKVEYSIENDDVRRMIYEALASDGLLDFGLPADAYQSGALHDSMRGENDGVHKWQDRTRISGFRIEGSSNKMSIHIDPYEVRDDGDFHYAQAVQDAHNWQPISDLSQRNYNSIQWQNVKDVIVKVLKR